MNISRLPGWYLTLSLALYLLSLAFDGAQMSAGRHMPALQMFLYGPWGVPFGMFQWFANPLFGLAILCHRRLRRLALLLGLAALYLAASSFAIERLPDNISYAFSERIGFGAGFYLWLAAMVVFSAGQAWQCAVARSRNDVPAWNWLDVTLIAALAVAAYAATQMPSLQFEPGKVLMPPEPVQTL